MTKKFLLLFLVIGMVTGASAKPLSVTIDEFFNGEYKALQGENISGVNNAEGKINSGSSGFTFALTNADYNNYPGKEMNFEATYTLDGMSDFCLFQSGVQYNVWVKGPNAGYDKTAKTVYVDCDGTYQVTHNVKFNLPEKEGTFDYTFMAGTSNWKYSIESDSVTVDVKDIKASIDASSTSIVAGEDVTFTFDNSQGYMGIDDMKVSVDGKTVYSGGYTSTYSHTFEEPGTYEVKLWIDDSIGRTDTDTVTVNVDSVPEPEANINGPSTAEVGTSPEFSAEGSEGYGDLDFTWYKDGNKVGEGKEQNIEFNSKGEHMVKVTVEGEQGNTASTDMIVNVNVKSPTAKFNYPNKEYMVGDSITISAANSKAGSYDISKYKWTINGNTLTGNEINYKFKSEGTKEIKLTVSDGHGNKDSMTKTVSVLPNPNNDNSNSDGSSGGTDDNNEQNKNFFKGIMEFLNNIFEPFQLG